MVTNTILTPDRLISMFPQITNQIEKERLQHFIEEAEYEHVKEKITDALYIELLNHINLTFLEEDEIGELEKPFYKLNNPENSSTNIFDENFDETFRKRSIYEILLRGGRYLANNNCNSQSPRIFKGLYAAIGYYAYSKLVRKNNRNITRFGYVDKDDEYSSSIEFKMQIADENDALKTADIYISDCITFIKSNIDVFQTFLNPVLKGRMNITVIN